MPPQRISRRTFLRTTGRGALGIAVFGIVATACSSNTPRTGPRRATTTAAVATTTATVVATSGRALTDTVSSRRIDLDFVSAYIIERGDGLVVIDTGVSGSFPAIDATLATFGRGWEDVGYVVATHKHMDHVGSWNAVIDAAGDAVLYAGGPDIPSIDSGRTITALTEGDLVNGITAIMTPGHTNGHVSMLDPDLGLFAGDALNGSGGTVIGPNPQFTPDMDTAFESVRKLARFDFDAAYFGHGEPVLAGASDAVRALAASL